MKVAPKPQRNRSDSAPAAAGTGSRSSRRDRDELAYVTERPVRPKKVAVLFRLDPDLLRDIDALARNDGMYRAHWVHRELTKLVQRRKPRDD